MILNKVDREQLTRLLKDLAEHDTGQGYSGARRWTETGIRLAEWIARLEGVASPPPSVHSEAGDTRCKICKSDSHLTVDCDNIPW